MKLFDIYGTLGIDTSQFEADIRAAQNEAQQLENVLNDVDSTDLDISKQRRKFVQSMKQMVDSVEDLDREMAKVGNSFDDVDVSKVGEKTSIASQMAQGALAGLAEAGMDLLDDAVGAMIQFAGDSLALVATMDTETGKMLRRSNKEWEYTGQVVMTRVGEALAPVVIALRDIASALLGVTGWDKVNAAAKELDALRFEHIAELQENLKGIFGLFEQVQMQTEEMPTIQDMIAGLDSQTSYWAQYEQIVNDLIKRDGVNKELLLQIATGTPESMSYLLALRNASDEELNRLMEAYNTSQMHRNATGEALGNVKADLDPTLIELEETLAGLIESISYDDTYKFSSEIALGYIDGLEDAYPRLQTVLDRMRAEFAAKPDVVWDVQFQYTTVGTIPNGAYTGGLEWWNTPVNQTEIHNGPGSDYWLSQGYTEPPKPNAKGLNYVPYNNYLSNLHVGEAVLTRQQADQWRAGQGNGFDMGAFAEMLTANLSNSVAGLRVQMDGRTVGQLVSGTVSKEIAKQSRRRLTSV